MNKERKIRYLESGSSLPCRGCTKQCPRFGHCQQRPWRDFSSTQTPSATPSTSLTLFYDGSCPLCVKEIHQLNEYDTSRSISTVDIHSPDFHSRYPMIDPVEANRILHGLLPDGRIIHGLDVTVMAWSLVDRHHWLKLLRLPLLRHVCDACYLLFARYRYSLSWMLTGRSRCDRCID